MDHRFAETEMSVQKYTLNELSPDERTQFEEHMFDCPVCSDLVRQDFAVTENLREVLLEEKQARAGVSSNAVQRSGWRAWLTIPSLVPTAAALALGGFIFTHGVGTEEILTARVVSPLATLKTASRGAVPVLHVNRTSPVTLLKFNVDKLSEGTFEGELDNSQGKKLIAVAPAVKSDDPVEIQFPTKALDTGRYKLILRSESHPDNIQTYAFEVD